MQENIDFVLNIFGDNISIDEIFVGIGENIPNAFGFEEASDEEKLQAGSTWWADNASAVKTIVCRYIADKDAVGAAVKDTIQIIFAALGERYGAGVAAYVTVLALRKAAEGWCAGTLEVH